MGTGQTPAYVVSINGIVMTMINDELTGPQKPLTIGQYTQFANGGIRPEEAEFSIDTTPLRNDAGEFVENAVIHCLVTIAYFDIYSVTKGIKSEKFSEGFVFSSKFPITDSTMRPTFANEKDKKTV